MMKSTGRQLHQGSHTSKAYQEPTAKDEAEEKEYFHEEYVPYLRDVDIMLNLVALGAQGHVNSCDDCKIVG